MAEYLESRNTSSLLVFFVNGIKIEDSNVDPEWTLLYYLRNKLRLCGTKLGCGEGGCGACTVMVSKYDRKNNIITHLPVNACLAPICSMHGLAVTTVEGIGSTKTRLHPVQERIAKSHGSQCGFCTPGIVMSMYTLLRSSPKPSIKEIEVALQGNLCRCTGYRPIIEGFKTFTEEWELMQNNSRFSNGVCAMGDKCCKLQNGVNKINGINGTTAVNDTNGINETNVSNDTIGNNGTIGVNGTNGFNDTNGVKSTNCVNGPNSVNGANGVNGINYGKGTNSLQYNNVNKNDKDDERLFEPREFKPYDPSQEPIFPPELKLVEEYDKQYLIFKNKNMTWYRPTKMKDLLHLKNVYPNAKIVVGNTEVGVEMKFKHMSYPVIIQPVQIYELTNIAETPSGVKIGAAVTLIEIQKFLRMQIEQHPEYRTRIFKAAVEMLNWFAGLQIRSVGALGSNIMTGSPISDMIPILMAAKAELEVQSEKRGIRKIILDNKFFIGYRKSILEPNEVLLSINIPFTNPEQYFEAYKQARRREDDIAIVNAAVNVTFQPESDIISDINLAFGGMSYKTVTAPKTERQLRGLPWNEKSLEIAYRCLLEDLPLDPGAPGGMIPYRKSLTLSLFFKAFLAISQKLQKFIPTVKLHPRDRSGIDGFHSINFKSSQYFTVVPSTRKKTDSLQRPIVHMSAYKQATGEAVYCDDIPHQEGELHCAFVLSTKPHANILNIDQSEALAMEGVRGFVYGKDLKREMWGTVVHDEKIFYSDKVTSQGQIIGLIVAENQSIAQKAARKVRIEYQELEPVVITIEDAIKHKSFYGDVHRILENGDIDKVLREAPYVVTGECRIGGQEHFYLETQACLVIPKKEDDEIEIYASTQGPSEISKLVAEVLGIHQNKVITKVKRIGGGFGGKESKAALVILPVAVAAKKFNRPIRCMLDRDEDIIMTGGRHPFLMKYKVAFNEHGKMLGCDCITYSNCGYSMDLSSGVMDRVITHVENAYKIPVIRARGYMCKTNLPSNTAFRGFGGPQAMYLAECMSQHIADFLCKDPAEISEINLYREGDITLYNQILSNCTISKCWEECIKSSHYYDRRKQVERFNRENRYKKRGLSIIPTKYGIAFTQSFMNQAGALVLVYTDGSVLLSHGGIEMGQGLYTKMIQVASRELDIPVEKIHISETATDKVPNTSPTAASSGSDLNGMAVMEACKIIKERLRPYREANPKGTWEQWVKTAYFDKVCLSAIGFYKINVGFDWNTKKGDLYNYFTYGVACTEVEIDTLTGDHQVLKTDIVMDIGESLNPAIDVGQIEGAFMQGYGLFVLEEMVYSPDGATFTRGPGTYKLPGCGDIPAEFNVSLLKGVSNPRAVYSSKAVGEPPLFLASSVLYAIKDAVKAARAENGLKKEHFRFDAPATSAKIRMACQDTITSMIKEPKQGSYKPWNVVV